MRPRPENAFREPGERRLGLIDWEQVLGGDPVLDIVKAEGRFLGRPDIPERERLCEALWEVPGACRGVAGRVRPAPERISGCDVPRGGGGVEEWAPRVNEPDAELAGWVCSALEERLDQV